MKRVFIAVDSSESDETGVCEELGKIHEVYDIKTGLYGANILAEVRYHNNSPKYVDDRIRKIPGVIGTRVF